MPSFKKMLSSVTMGNPHKLWPMIMWTFIESFLKGVPVSATLLIVWVVFQPLQNPNIKYNLNVIYLICFVLFLLLLLTYFVGRKAYKLSNIDGYTICRDGRIAIIDHLRRLPMGFYKQRDPGDIGSYLVDDYANIEMLITHLVPKLISALALPIIALFMTFFFDWRLALAATLVIPLTYPLVLITNYLVRYLGKKLQSSKVLVSSRMIEYIQNIRLIKAYNLSGINFNRLNNACLNLKKTAIRVEAAPSPIMVLANIVLNAGLVIIMLIGLNYLLDSQISIPTYIMFLIMAMVIYAPLMEALTYLAEINYMNLSVNRIEQLRLIPKLPEGNIEEVKNNNITFKNISFGYNPSIPVIRNISLTIPEKSLTAFVGPSGSGKTTLTALIARFWDVDEGEVLLGEHNIKSYTINSLMSQISIVFQDVYLFNDTILNNIRIGKEDASDEEIKVAAKAAHCHEFIDALPDKYNTIVGEGGSTLSGGEKQRISIARAILKDAPIILLDEATASLDPENEKYIQKAISELVKDRTVVIIAHRLNTVIAADNIVVIGKGRIIEQGKHQELLKHNGFYANLWKEQQETKGWKF